MWASGTWESLILQDIHTSSVTQSSLLLANECSCIKRADLVSLLQSVRSLTRVLVNRSLPAIFYIISQPSLFPLKVSPCISKIRYIFSPPRDLKLKESVRSQSWSQTHFANSGCVELAREVISYMWGNWIQLEARISLYTCNSERSVYFSGEMHGSHRMHPCNVRPTAYRNVLNANVYAFLQDDLASTLYNQHMFISMNGRVY